MSYLKFDKTLLINLEESLTREVLRTNRKGAYHCTTIVDCNTRKYHGLLVMPVPWLDDDNHVLLSVLDETVVQHGAEFNLGLHKYSGGTFSPNGHKYIREYAMEAVPRTVYRVGGVVLSKEKIFSHTDNQILIKYTLLDAHSETKLRFRPFMAFRNVKELTHVNGSANQSCREIPNGVKACMYPGYPELHMQFNKPPKFVYEPCWYRDIEYPKEQERGYPYKEDLFVPGYFELPIRKGESVVFCAGDILREQLADLPAFFDGEVSERTPRSNFYNCLKNSTKQLLYNPKGNDLYMLAGYPWFKVRARDLFIAMPGAWLCTDEKGIFERLMQTALPAVRAFMRYGRTDAVIREIDEPDVLLWIVWCIQQYRLKNGLEEARERYGALVEEIIEYLVTQQHPNLKWTDNGLVYSDGRQKPVTWMNSMVDGRPVIPRSGYIVEFNALWYNALQFYREMKHPGATATVERIVRALDTSFPATFVNRYNYLFDYIDGPNRDWSVRPNMVIALACAYSPLTRTQKRAALDIVTKELLTPKGLRSLSPKSEGYRPNCFGPQRERDLAYHQGAVWPWLTGPYLTAYLSLFGHSGVSFTERMLISLEEEVSLHCIGTLSEIYDGNPPFAGRGAFSFAMSITSVLYVIDKLKAYEVE
ncbi:MAG: amylo-alpha-1,6-glucosidase [Tannerella sp.]|jgi:predicted glycogen debranching enzyme|nr:amylo-alpha-1,6-glucosidase [Tannerella sp.]